MPISNRKVSVNWRRAAPMWEGPMRASEHGTSMNVRRMAPPGGHGPASCPGGAGRRRAGRGGHRGLPDRAGVSPGRAGDADLRLAGRGRSCASGALDPRRRRPAAVRAARPGPTSGCCGCRSRTAGVSSTSSAIGQRRARGPDPRSAQPRRGRATRSARTRWRAPSATSGRSGACRAGAPAGRIEEIAVESRAFGEARGGAGLPAGRPRSGARPIRSSSSMTATTSSPMPTCRWCSTT